MSVHIGAVVRPIHGRFDRILRALELVAVVTAGCLLVTAMVLISLDALLRYAVNRPLAFQYTLTEDYLLVGLFLMALPWGFRTGGYIRIDATSGWLNRKAQHLLVRAGLLLSAAYTAVLAWKAGGKYADLLITGEVKIGVVYWPLHYSWMWIPMGLSLLTARLFLAALGPEEDLSVRHDPDEEL